MSICLLQVLVIGVRAGSEVVSLDPVTNYAELGVIVGAGALYTPRVFFLSLGYCSFRSEEEACPALNGF
ncbi:MAG: hypothetical protein CL484_09155 [Acidobacteria bacterium]|nr:hypothetical protein [Acidobacteriota bacterium]